ncbi:MAG TPA: HU family DNA-binding protein [Ignavibacteria bacterium]|nr:HU family DNA-binding protein [Ignavibacteria bacterium]HRA99849.1 HU family DNA-binding protein [Ignavibacteria bacterium]
MNRKELIKIVSEETGLKKKKCERAVESAFELISQALIKGSKVSITNFGSFRTQKIGSEIYCDGSFVNIIPPSVMINFEKNI